MRWRSFTTAFLSMSSSSSTNTNTNTNGGSGKNQIIISDHTTFMLKKEKFLAEGSSKLQVLCDWDFTMTHFFLDGRRACSCHKALEDSDLLPQAYHETAQALQTFYYAKEIDHTLAMPEKVQYMVEWVEKAHEALISYKFRRELLAPAVKDAHLLVREGTQEIIDLTAKGGADGVSVPLLIFSAGIADVIEEVCRQQLPKALPENVHIVSNKMIFSDEGVLTGFTDPVFHVFNKRASAVIDTAPYFHEDNYEQKRKNVVLCGDSLGDLHMSDGLEFEDIIRVGFLNDRVEERLEEYKAKFDVVLLGDGDLSFVLELLTEIIHSKGENNGGEGEEKEAAATTATAR